MSSLFGIRQRIGSLTPNENWKMARTTFSVVYGRSDTNLLVYDEISKYHTQTD